MKDEVDLFKEAEREKIHRLDALNHEHKKEVGEFRKKLARFRYGCLFPVPTLTHCNPKSTVTLNRGELGVTSVSTVCCVFACAAYVCM